MRRQHLRPGLLTANANENIASIIISWDAISCYNFRVPTHPLRCAYFLLGGFLSLGILLPSAKADLPAEVALAVVYDTSGSMRAPILSSGGRMESKHIVAQRAFGLVIDRLERFTALSEDGSAKRLDLSIVTFAGSRAQEAVPMTPLNVAATRRWLAELPQPDSSTPLGDAMMLAGRALLSTPALSKHLLVLTDGENTTGSNPLSALMALQKQSQGQDQPVFVHILALDIPPAVFASLRKAGATLIGAADEKQLQSQLDFILENQILVEAP
jgi:hypothetical protein